MSVDIKSLSLDELGKLMYELGEPTYRTRQLIEWLYVKHVDTFDEMTNLPKTTREQLQENFILPVSTIASTLRSTDATRKYLIRFADGTEVETVAMPSGERLTVCVSTQAGCAFGCGFCATGKAGFTRNLTCGEIVDQVLLAAADLNLRPSNVVLMGQGEPFVNYDASLTAMRIMNSPQALEIGARKITLSTLGLIKGITQFAREPEQFGLAVSLHSALQETRDVIMPGAKSNPLDRLRQALIAYSDKTGRRPTLEYALMEGVNDAERELDALITYCSGLLCHVNLITLNEVPGLPYQPAPQSTAQHFQAALMSHGIETSMRRSRGQDIDAACGQLAQRR